MGMLEAVDPGREEGENCENEEFMLCTSDRDVGMLLLRYCRGLGRWGGMGGGCSLGDGGMGWLLHAGWAWERKARILRRPRNEGICTLKIWILLKKGLCAPPCIYYYYYEYLAPARSPKDSLKL